MSVLPANQGGMSLAPNETLSLQGINTLFARSFNLSEEYARYAVFNDTRATSLVVPDSWSAPFLNSVFGLMHRTDSRISPFVRGYWDDLSEEERRSIANRMVYHACRQSTSVNDLEQCIRNERRTTTLALSTLSVVAVTGVSLATLPLWVATMPITAAVGIVGCGLATLFSNGITVTSAASTVGIMSALSIPVARIDDAVGTQVAYLVNATTLSAKALQFRLEHSKRSDAVRFRLYEKIVNMTSELEKLPWNTERAIDLRRGIFQTGLIAKAFSPITNSFWVQKQLLGQSSPGKLLPSTPALPPSPSEATPRVNTTSIPSSSSSPQVNTTLAVLDVVQAVQVTEQLTTPVEPEPLMTPQEEVLIYTDQVLGIDTSGPQVFPGLDAKGTRTKADIVVAMGRAMDALLGCVSNLWERVWKEIAQFQLDEENPDLSQTPWERAKRTASCFWRILWLGTSFVDDLYATPVGRLVLFVLALLLACFAVYYHQRILRKVRGFFRVGWTTLQAALKVFQGMSVRMERGMSPEEVAEEMVGGFFTLPVLLRSVEVKDPAVHRDAPKAIREHSRSQPTPPPVTRRTTRQAVRTEQEEEQALAFHQLLDPTLPPSDWATKHFLATPEASELRDTLMNSTPLVQRDRQLAHRQTRTRGLVQLQLLALVYAL